MEKVSRFDRISRKKGGAPALQGGQPGPRGALATGGFKVNDY